MKLSEAMMLGSTTCKMIPGDWNSCALGCAGNAVGIPQANAFNGIHTQYLNSVSPRYAAICAEWPWILDGGFASEIWERFDLGVCKDQMTLEQLVDYVRSIEPECGRCNSFECTCKPAAVPEAETEKVTA